MNATERLIYLATETRSWQKEYFKLVKLLGRQHEDTRKALRSSLHFEGQLDKHLEEIAKPKLAL